MEWEEVTDRLHKALYKIDGTLVCDDSNRYMDSDNFYELKFTLVLPDVEIYLETLYDYDGDVEEEFSINNPQVVDSYVLIGMFNQDKLEEIVETLESYINGDYSDTDYNFDKTYLQYRFMLED